MRAVLLKRLKRLAEKFEPPNVGPRTAVRLPQRAASGYRKTGVSLRLTWRCRLRSLEIESRLNIGSVAVNALHPQIARSTEYHSANLVPAWARANPSVWRTPRAPAYGADRRARSRSDPACIQYGAFAPGR
jgi:hypothetical protein